ncbi:MAG: hypothetical protein AAF519_10910 [Bacteroidota bacterium]
MPVSGEAWLRDYDGLVRYGDLVFRLTDLDAFSHQPNEEDQPWTLLQLKGYTLSYPDPDKALFLRLKKLLNPVSLTDERTGS